MRIGKKIETAPVITRDIELIILLSDKTLKVPETPFPDLCTIYSELWKEFNPHAKAPSFRAGSHIDIQLEDRKGIWFEEKNTCTSRASVHSAVLVVACLSGRVFIGAVTFEKGVATILSSHDR